MAKLKPYIGLVFDVVWESFFWWLHLNVPLCPLKQNVSSCLPCILLAQLTISICLFVITAAFTFSLLGIVYRGPFFLRLYFVFGCFANMNVFTPGVCSTLWSEKRVSDLLELELETVVTLHVGAGNWTRSFGRAASALNLWAVSPIQHWHFQWVFLLIM